MEHLVVNRIGKPRRATLNGREHIVVPMTMIVPGVLNGSQGPLFYSEDEVRRNPSDWNGMPILLGHPEEGSGRTPDVINKFGVGTVFKARYTSNRLKAEAWLDIIKLQELAPAGILDKIQTGGGIELSTGFASGFDKNPGTHNGRNYNAAVINIRPDHLAIFVNGEIGACSMKDGCGVNNSKSKGAKKMAKTRTATRQTTNKKNGGAQPPTDERGELIESLVTNCGCDKEELDALDDNALDILKKVHDTKVVGEGFTANQDPDEEETEESDDATEEDSQTENEESGDCGKTKDARSKKMGMPKKKKPAVTVQNQEREVSLQEWLESDSTPAEIRNWARDMMEQRESEKEELIAQIVKNQSCPFEQKELKGMMLEDETINNRFIPGLRSLAAITVPQNIKVAMPSFMGANVTNRVNNSFKPTPLGIPAWEDHFADKN